MKKILLSLPFFLLIPAVWNCSNPDTDSKDLPFHVDFEEYDLSVDLKLSDLMEDCRLVALETTNESLLPDNFQVINLSGDYIIIHDRGNVYKFSSDGKFIRKVLRNGRGPGEISVSCMYDYDNKANILYFEDDFNENDVIKRFDMEAEKFLPPIPKCFKGFWLDLELYQDSLIMGSIEGVLRGETNPYALFIQNFKGDLIEGIKSNRTFIIPRPDNTKDEVLQRAVFYTGDENMHVMYWRDDTLFTLKNMQLSPYLIAEHKGKYTVPNLMPTEGDTFTYYDQYENPGFMFIQHSLFTGWTSEGSFNRAHYKKDYIILNKTTGKYGLIQSYEDDFNRKNYLLGKALTIKPGVDKEFPKPKTSPDGLIFTTYYPTELPESITNNAFKDLADQLNTLNRTLKETDNPVLLIGKPKKKLRILD
jgi:hypothetical protein